MSVYLFSAALISAAVSWLVSELSRRGGVLDFPEARSLHATPTPRSGGLGILAGCGAGALVLLAAPVGAPGMAAALAFAGACGALGFLDDLFALNGRIKFACMCALCLALAGLYPVDRLSLTLEWSIALFPVLAVAGSALFLFTVINAVNFVDGSDGMLAAVLIPAGIGLAVAGLASGSLSTSFLGVLLAGSLLGMLGLNLPPAKLFAGDAGSLAAGALYGAGALLMAGRGFAGSLWLAPLFVLPVLVDVLLTLLRRARHGRLSLEAHSEHAFQRLIKTGWSHAQAAMAYGGLSSLCVLAGLVAAQGPDAAPFLAFVLACAGLTGAYAWAGAYARRRGVDA
ncbi:glycosyltransferase family 4 protein [Marinicauda sp. Alg238-R41]|uniref:glycosyltransferase family 4 protein n=1 Tax=Marinicauda sp. Alg238-R41 TaxID=2993447 RepID=UPI0022E4C3D5|nr:hypothetical protein [Marinicauda sp. Alg238-R41]